MKYPVLLLVFCLGLITLISSCEEEINDPIVQVIPKLSSIQRDGQDQSRYYYENDKLVELQDEIYKYDEELDSSWYETVSRFFEYENGRLSRVYSGSNYEVFLTYDGADLTITNFHSQYDDAKMTFKNYKDNTAFRMELFYLEGTESNFSPEFDSDGNFLFSNDDNGVDLQIASPGFYYLSQYYGNYSYNEMNHASSNFDLEVQLYLYQKPFKNCVESIDKINRKIIYEYEFDSNNFPISSEASTIGFGTQDTFSHGRKDYFYE